MNVFPYKNGQLHAEGVPVEELARRYGTPLFIYSRSHLQNQFRALARAMRPVRPLICFSVKTNTNAAVIQTFVREGAGADVVSGGELFRARRAGVPASKIVFAGVGKTVDEIDYALSEDILFFTVESEPELDRLAERAEKLGRTARVAFRVNPDVDPQTHRYISTGKKENKFGMDLPRVERACETAGRRLHVEVVGLHMHIGSQILSPDPYADALRKIQRTCARVRRNCPTFRYIDIGGGLGIQYTPEQQPLDPRRFARAVLPFLRKMNLDVIMEPGRFLVGNSGILVTQVQYVKAGPSKKFVIVDAGMNDLIRPALYQAYHEVQPVRRTSRRVLADLVGPICESGDFLATDRHLPAVREGDLLAVCGAGAYSFSMSSNYNSRGRAAEVMVWKGKNALVRRREIWDDLIRGERLPVWK